MTQSAAQLANLQTRPPFEPGNKLPRRSADVDAAIRKLRRSAPDAVDYVIRCMSDPEEKTELRLKAALGIIDKCVPNNDPRLTISADSIGQLKIVFVAPVDTPVDTPLLAAE